MAAQRHHAAGHLHRAIGALARGQRAVAAVQLGGGRVAVEADGIRLDAALAQRVELRQATRALSVLEGGAARRPRV